MKNFNYRGKTSFNVGILGATGLVGKQMLAVLEERKFPIDKLKLFSTERSAGSVVDFKGGAELVVETDPDLFSDLDFILASAGRGPAREYGPLASKAGCVFIDNSSAWRMDDSTPLVVPEVNPEALDQHVGIIANPNCSTIQMVVALKPLHDLGAITRVVVSTYQSVSGAGKDAMDELLGQYQSMLAFEEPDVEQFPHRIAGNCIPHIGPFNDDGSSEEEMKMINETRKMLDPSIQVAPTAVRVPVFIGHSESLNIEFAKPVSVEAAREALANAPGIAIVDDPKGNEYPMAKDCVEREETLVGRIRKDPTVEHGIALWIVSDNLRKGAALNTVQIAEELLRRHP